MPVVGQYIEDVDIVGKAPANEGICAEIAVPGVALQLIHTGVGRGDYQPSDSRQGDVQEGRALVA